MIRKTSVVANNGATPSGLMHSATGSVNFRILGEKNLFEEEYQQNMANHKLIISWTKQQFLQHCQQIPAEHSWR